MSTTANKDLVRRVFEECLNGRQLEVADEIIAADFAWNNNRIGCEGFKQNFSAIFDVFPGIYWTLEELITQGDQVLFRLWVSGVHRGEPWSPRPNGDEVIIRGTAICRCVGRQIVALWQFADDLDLIQRLGATKPMSDYDEWLAHSRQHDHPGSLT